MHQQGGCFCLRQLGAMLEYNEPFTTVTLCCDGRTELEERRERLEPDGMNLDGNLRIYSHPISDLYSYLYPFGNRGQRRMCTLDIA